MDIFSVFTLLGGLAFFLYGMTIMSQNLEKVAGGRLESIVAKMTSNRFMGLLLGCVITIAIQSSSAVTVMLVGLVNSGIMEIANTVGVIMGSNIGTTITAWIMSLIGVSDDNVFIRMLKPESFSPLVAFIGILLIMASRSEKKKDVGSIFVGFAILMYGMVLMSGSVSPLADSPAFKDILTAFNNPLLGILAGLVVTAVIQSSAASVGMLQALTLVGGISYGMAIPVIMGQNIGTCATAVLSSFGVGRNAKRVSVIHISFNVIGTVLFMVVFYGLDHFIDFSFMDKDISPVGVAFCHSVFNVVTTMILLPFSNKLVWIAKKIIKAEPVEHTAFIDERLFATPSIAVSECERLGNEMAEKAMDSIFASMDNIHGYSKELSSRVRSLEEEIDIYEDHLGTYLVRLSEGVLSEAENVQVTKMLHSIGNFERLSDHALNILGSADELSGKGLRLSEEANKELDVLEKAVRDIVTVAIGSYMTVDTEKAKTVEPLEQVIDLLTAEIKNNHIERLKRGECSIQNGFILSDLLNDYERISDHCSNIAIAVLQTGSESYDSHELMNRVKDPSNTMFEKMYEHYKDQYAI